MDDDAPPFEAGSPSNEKAIPTPARRPRALAALLAASEANAFLIMTLGVCAGLLALLERSRLGDDSWYTVLAGRLIVHSGLPHHNSWTVISVGHAWTDQQWLAQLAGYGLWWLGGWRLALLAITVCYSGAFAILALTARRLGASDSAIALALILCFIGGISNTEFRTELPAYLLFATVLSLLLLDERTPSRRVYVVFPLLVLWANLHGSVVLGAGMVALRGATIAAAELRSRAAPRTWLPRAGLFLVLPWLCTLVSPYGIALLGYYKSVLDNPALESTGEWMPSTAHNQPIYYALLFLGLWLVYRCRGALTPFHSLAFTVTAIGGTLAIRNVVWFALVGGVALPLAIDALWSSSPAPRRRSFNVALAAGGCTFALASIAAVSAHSDAWYQPDYPHAAAQVVERAMSASPKLRVYATDEDADWLLFEDPAVNGRVAYDVRYELLSPAQFSELADFRDQSGANWERVASGYGLLVLDRLSEQPLIATIVRQKASRVIFRDKAMIVIRRAVGGAVPQA